MTTTEGMADGYDDASTYQRDVAATGAERLDAIVDGLPFEPGEVSVLLDLGAASGRNSMQSIRAAVEALHARRGVTQAVAIHQNLPTNDWNQLFADVTGDAGSYTTVPGVRAVPMASAGSFFDVTTAPGSVHLALSSSAAHWLRAVPAVAVDGMYACEATGAARRRLAEAAAADWAAFLQARAVELRPGGALLVQCVGTAVDADGTEHVTARELLAAMWEVARGMAADGLLYLDVVDAYTFGVYPRTAEEASAPLHDPALGLVAEEVSVAPVANPYLAELERTGDVAAYARAYVAFVRGFTESALTDGLFRPSVEGSCRVDGLPAVREEYYRRLEAAFVEDPTGTAFRDWTLTVVARRR